MATNWQLPQTISQYAEEGAENFHILWDDTKEFSGLKSLGNTYVGTLGGLYHIARSPKPNITTKTYYLKLTNFKILNLPDTITGIELKVEGRRAGRVTDDTISLSYNNELIGENRATLEVSPTKVYGSETDNWGVDVLTPNMISDPTFGVVLRFKSHPQWPHNDPIDLVSVQLRIY